MTTMKGLYLEDLTFREFCDWLAKEKIDLFELKELVLQQGRRKYASIDDWMKEVEQSEFTRISLKCARTVRTRVDVDNVHRTIIFFLRQDYYAFWYWKLYLGNAKQAIAELWEIPSISLPVLKNVYTAFLMMNILEARGKLNKEIISLMMVDR